MNRSRAVIILSLISVATVLGQSPSVPTLPKVPTGKMIKLGLDLKVPLPKEGLVPDNETAIKIAEVILLRLGVRKASPTKNHMW